MTITAEQREVMQGIARMSIEEFRKEVRDKIIPETVKATLEHLGHETDPQESQANQLFLRNLRRKAEKWEDTKVGIIGRIIGGVLTAALIAYFSYTIGSAAKADDVILNKQKKATTEIVKGKDETS